MEQAMNEHTAMLLRMCRRRWVHRKLMERLVDWMWDYPYPMRGMIDLLWNSE